MTDIEISILTLLAKGVSYLYQPCVLLKYLREPWQGRAGEVRVRC